MLFKISESMKISVLPEQEKYLSTIKDIKEACANESVLAFDVYSDDLLIGFIMVRKFDKGAYFLWDYAIDYRYQNRGYGTTALTEFINFMKNTYDMTKLTTTYIWGNNHAKHLYEKIGFIETDIVDEDNCHEVNMIYYC